MLNITPRIDGAPSPARLRRIDPPLAAPRARATAPRVTEDEPIDFAEMLNARRGGLNAALGLSFVRATRDEVIAELTIGPEHLQPYGLVHGGVYCAMAETVASSGAAIHAMAEGRHTVGLENSTSFLRAVREGKVRATGTPLSRGRRSQVWEVAMRDDQGRLVATGRVRLLVLEPEAEVAGEAVRIKG